MDKSVDKICHLFRFVPNLFLVVFLQNWGRVMPQFWKFWIRADTRLLYDKPRERGMHILLYCVGTMSWAEVIFSQDEDRSEIGRIRYGIVCKSGPRLRSASSIVILILKVSSLQGNIGLPWRLYIGTFLKALFMAPSRRLKLRWRVTYGLLGMNRI